MRFVRAFLVAMIALSPVVIASPAESTTSAIPVLLVSVPHSKFAYVLESANSGCGHTLCLWFSRISDPPAPTSDRTFPPLHAFSGQPTGNIESLQFTSLDDGYLWTKEGRVSALYVTTNGARTWRRTVTTSSLMPVHPFGATQGHIYFVTETCSGMGICRDFRLHAAGSSGANWTSRPLALSPDTSGVGLGAIGSDLWIEEGPITGTRILFSRDAGRTFTQWTPNIYDVPTGCIMTASTQKNIWAQCPTGMNWLYEVSVDGGHHWRAIDTGGFIPTTAGCALDPLNASVAFVDLGANAQLNGDNLLKSGPGGTTTKVGVLGCTILLDLDFIDSSHGLADCQETQATKSTVLLMTSNGGMTWIPFH